MNRQIIFRAKTLKEGEWVYGDLEYSRYNDTTRIHVYDENGFYDGQHYVQCDTVGQYTGVDDKNGKPIFEGDIVRYLEANDEPTLSVVRFVDCSFSPITEVIWMGDGEFEVLGNRFDNPKLLEQ